jgi:hypothetical protein
MKKSVFVGLLLISSLMFCGIIPLPGEDIGLLVGPVLFVGTLITWVTVIGPRLHESLWQKLAEQPGLNYQPRNTPEKGAPASITGTYLERSINLTTQIRPGWERSILELLLTVEVENPAGNSFVIHKLGKFDMKVNRTLGDAGTGDADFDRVFVLSQVNPEGFITQLLQQSGLGKAISQMAKGNRRTEITLQDNTLSFREEPSLGFFSGVETDIERLESLIETMCQLAEAIDES